MNTTALEALEPRFMLSVALRGGTLAIVGTAGDDHIQLTHPNAGASDLSRTLVDFNGMQLEFKTSDIKRILIDGREGDDFVQVGLSPFFSVCGAFHWPPDPYPFLEPVPALLFGRAGSDTLIGGTGRDMIRGGAGSDQLYGSDNNDFISGGAGDDGIFGGGGDDQLRGGNGNDGLQGGSGSDRLFGQAGDDVLDGDSAGFSDVHEGDKVFAGSGDDTLFADASDQISGGEGDDLLRYMVRGISIHGTPELPSFDVPSDIERIEPYYFGGECV